MIFKGAALEETGDRLGAIEWYKKAEAAASPSDYENLGYVNMRLGNLYMNSYIENHEDIEKKQKCTPLLPSLRKQKI